MPEVQGKLIVKGDVQEFGANGFKVRKFVVEIPHQSNPDWNQFRELQLTQDRCDLLEPHKVNEEIKVQFNLDGRRYEKDGKTMYFNSDTAWRIEKVESAPSTKQEPAKTQQAEEETDDLPF